MNFIKTIVSTVWIVVAILLSASVTPASTGVATEVSASATIIDFDTLDGGSPSDTRDGDIITTQYEPLGVIFVNPNPQREFYAHNNPILSSSPPNAAFFDAGGGSSGITSPLQIRFNTPISQVSFDVAMSSQATVTLQLFDASDSVLASFTTPINRSGGILHESMGVAADNSAAYRAAVFSVAPSGANLNFALDDVQFTAVPVPEPTVGVLFVCGLFFLFFFKNRRNVRRLEG